ARAKRDLESMGVEVRLNARVTKVDEDGVWMGDEQLPAQTVVWAAGVEPPAVLRTMGVDVDRGGHVKVNPDLSVPGHSNVFVFGEAAGIIDQKTNEPVPGLAPAAIQMGQHVAKVIRAEVEKNVPVSDRPAFKYVDKGTMATIGKRRAVADIKGF